MQRFILGRLLQGFVTVALLVAVVFLLSRLLGSPLDILLPIGTPLETQQRLAESLGLDEPLYLQFAIYVRDVATGNLGNSIQSRIPVADLIALRLPNSMQLAAVTMFFTLLLAIPLGTLAAVKKGTWIDSAVRLLALVNMSLPSFWVGIVLIQIFAVQLRWLPVSGSGGLLHYVLPAVTMGGFTLAGIVRLTRTSMLEVLDSEYVLFARTKGLSERAVVFRHALRNSFLPVLGFGGTYFSIMITMAVTIEAVFGWPGMGSLAYDAIKARDFPVIQGVILVIGVIVTVVNLLIDVLYAAADPRIRLTR